MRKLLKFEIRKLLKMKSFYICLLICLLMLSIEYILTRNNNQTTANALKSSLVSSYLVIILSIFTSFYTCEDYQYGTIKNIYSKGYSRTKVFLSKYIISSIVTILYSIIIILFAFILSNLLVKAKGELNSSDFLALGGQIIIFLAYHSIFFLLAFIFEKNGIGIALGITCPLFISLALGAIDDGLKIKNFKISSYWLDSLITALQTNFTMNNFYIALGISAEIIIICTSIALIFAKRKEI